VLRYICGVVAVEVCWVCAGTESVLVLSELGDEVEVEVVVTIVMMRGCPLQGTRIFPGSFQERARFKIPAVLYVVAALLGEQCEKRER
jgi:hypothetical protein